MSARQRLVRNGNPTNTAWLRGWDVGVCGLPVANPYKRAPQQRAWDAGRMAAQRGNDADVKAMKNRTFARENRSKRSIVKGEP